MSRDDFDDDWQQAMRIFRGEELEIDESKLESDFGEAVRVHQARGAALGMPEEAPTLDELAAQQQAEQDAAAAIAPFVRIAPPSMSGAKSSGQQLCHTGDAPIQVVDWHGPDEDNLVVTVSAANIAPPANLPQSQQVNAWPNPSPSVAYRPYARILYGVGGVQFYIEVDIPGGAIPGGGVSGALSGGSVQLSLGASNVIVQVGMDAGPTGFPDGYMQLGATVTPLPTDKATPLFRTRYYDAVTTNATQVIPPGATQIYPVRRSDVSKQLLIEIQNCSGTVIDQISVAANTQMANPYPLPADAYQVKVTNQTGGSVDVRVPFGLSV